nr:hypothetical protein CFP56_67490 [Quercus suber]
MREAVTTGLRERQRASVEVERLVEAQSGLREWSARENEGETWLREAISHLYLIVILCILGLTIEGEGEGRDNSGELLYTVDLTDQVAETMAVYRDQIARLMLANNRHH